MKNDHKGLIIIEDNLNKCDNIVEDYLNKKDEINSVLVIACKKAEERKISLGKSYKQCQLMFSLLRDWLDGRYQEVSLNTIGSILLTLFYLILPKKNIFRIFDNIRLVKRSIRLLNVELQNYRRWKEAQIIHVK